MQVHNNFDLEEILAYIVPGFLFLSVLLVQYSGFVSVPYDTIGKGTSEFFAVTLALVLFIAVSMILGHIFSLASRFVWRSLINTLFGDPENAIFERCHPFFTPRLNDLLATRFQQIFDVPMTDGAIRLAVPRLIRSVVVTRSDRWV
jgi:hypothetical protein